MKKLVILLILSTFYNFSINAQDKEDIVEYNKFLLDLQSKIVKSHEEKVVVVKDLANISAKLEEINKQLNEIRSNVRLEETNLKQKNGGIKILEKDIDKLRDQMMSLSNTLELKHLAIDSLNEIVHALESDIKVNQQKEQLKKDQLYEVEQEITMHSQEMNGIRGEIMVLNEASQKQKGIVRENEIAISLQTEKLQYEQGKYDKVQSKLNSQYKEKDNFIIEIKTLEEKITADKSKVSTNKSSIAGWEKELEQLKTKIGSLEGKQANSDLNADEYKSITTDLEALKAEDVKRGNELHRLKQQTISTETEIQKSESQIKLLKSDVANAENKITELQTEQLANDMSLKTIQAELHQLNENINKANLEINHNNQLVIRKNKSVDEISIENNERISRKNGLKAEIAAIHKDIKTTQEDIKSDLSRASAEKKEMQDIRGRIEIVNHSLKEKETVLIDRRAEAHQQEDNIEDVRIQEKGVVENQKRIQLKNDSLQKYVDAIAADADSILLEGIELALEALSDTSIQFFQTVIDMDNKNTNAHFLKAYTQYIHGRPDPALSSIKKLIAVDSRYIPAFKLRAKIYMNTGKYLYALKDYDHIIYLDKKDSKSLIERGKLYYFKISDYKKGCEDWNEALNLGNSSANILIADNCNLEEKTDYEVKSITKRAIQNNYGIAQENPIKVGKDAVGRDSNIRKYLELLRGSNGKPVKYHKTGTCCPYNTKNGVEGKGLLQKYEVEYVDKKGKKVTTLLYFSHFDYDSPQLPVGFKTDHDIY